MNVFTVSVTAASLLPEQWPSHSFFPQISNLSYPGNPWPSQICHHLGTTFLMTFMTSEYLPSRCRSVSSCDRSDLTASSKGTQRAAVLLRSLLSPPSSPASPLRPPASAHAYQLVLQKSSYRSWDTFPSPTWRFSYPRVCWRQRPPLCKQLNQALDIDFRKQLSPLQKRLLCNSWKSLPFHHC